MPEFVTSREINNLPAQQLLALLPGLDTSLLDVVRSDFANFTSARGRNSETWQHAWNDYIGNRRIVTITPSRCQTCHGRVFSARNVGRNLSRTGNPLVCGDCRGSRRGSPVSMPARPAPHEGS